MGFITRFLLFVYALAVALVALGVVALCFNFLPEHVLINEMRFALSRWETVAGAFVVFLLSVHLLGCCFSSSDKSKSESEAIVVHGANGDVRVAVSAVSDLVEKNAMSVHGVKEAKAKVKAHKEADQSMVKVSLHVMTDAERNVATISDDIRDKVGKHMVEVLGIQNYSLDIDVPRMEENEPAKLKRVN